MRWSKKRKLTARDERIIERFLFFPKCLRLPYPSDEKEWRWWERCKIVQYYSPFGWVDWRWEKGLYATGD